MQMRRKNLQTQYNFHCECIACTEDYPPFANLKPAPIPVVVHDCDLRTLNKYTLDCEELFYKYCTFLMQFDQHYPCLQVVGAQECMKMSFNVLMRNVPLALRTSN